MHSIIRMKSLAVVAVVAGMLALAGCSPGGRAGSSPGSSAAGTGAYDASGGASTGIVRLAAP
jgi:hypothetical protein